MTAAAPGARARTVQAWRAGVAALLAGVLSQALAAGPAENADIWLAMDDGAAVLMRHAEAPGGGDPPGFRLDDCTTQRNLALRSGARPGRPTRGSCCGSGEGRACWW